MDNKQVIISVGREFGSGGHMIAEKLSERFSLPLYDHNLLREVSKGINLDLDTLEKYDEVPKNRLFSRNIMGYSTSPQENLAHIQFNYIKEKAESGESFVVVGRCSETILKEYEGLISIFILGDKEHKIERVSEIYKMTREEAKELMSTKDKKRKAYHNFYCKGKWGDSRNYDLSINSSKLGVDETVDIIEDYIKRCIGEK